MKMREETRQFIVKSLEPYFKDSSVCGYENKKCKYLTDGGKRCVIGQYMNPGKWQEFKEGVHDLFYNYDPQEIFAEELLSHDLDLKTLELMQSIHDYIARGMKKEALAELMELEITEKVLLTELKNLL